MSKMTLCAVGALLVACGGAAETAPAAVPEELPATAEVEPASEPVAAPEPEAPAAEQPAAQELQPPADPEPRKVIYRVTPEGLIIEVEGLRLTPKATARKLSNGGFVIDLVVLAEAIDERSHTLSSPALGPLAIAAKIFDKKGNLSAEYSDRREGSEQQFVMPGGPLTFERTWPSGSVKGPLWWGQRVRLHAGLWGLGTDGDSGRPLRKLFVVDMSGKANATPIITPPDVD